MIDWACAPTALSILVCVFISASLYPLCDVSASRPLFAPLFPDPY